jgi:hypothetical protein
MVKSSFESINKLLFIQLKFTLTQIKLTTNDI